MGRRNSASILLLAVLAGPGARRASAQVTLADDIILAAQGKENAERSRKPALGHPPGTQVSPYRRSPGSGDLLLGVDPNRRLAPLPRLARRPANPSDLSTPGAGRGELGHGLAPGIERLPLPPALPPGGPAGTPAPRDDAPEDEEGPPGGLTLDAAVERLVRCNSELRSKHLEIPQAEADVLTAGLRENPLLFYSSDSVPYGSYSKQRPGEISHGLSLVLPFDYSGKRRARVTLAEREKQVLEAQYRNAVRLAIDDLNTAFVDALAQRQAARSAGRGLGLLDGLLARARAEPARGGEDTVDDLTIERELAALSAGDERARYVKARQRLAALLDLSPGEADALELRGSLRDLGPKAPPTDSLVAIALGRRPDLAAFRLGVARAQAEFSQERAERFSDAYFLYTPFEYRDNSQVGLGNSTAWGAGVFVSVPLFNRNQGNLKRARINVEQSRRESAALEAQVVAEVRQAVRDFENTYEDALRLEGTALPAVRRKRDRALGKLRAGEIGTDVYLSVQRDSTTLVRYYRDTLARHRRNALKLNTAVGHRVLP